MTSHRKLPGLHGDRRLHELAVHHHERLGNGALKAGRFLGFIVGEGEDELPQPGVTPPVAVVARAGAMGHGRGQQRVEKLLRTHRLELHLAEQPVVFIASLCLPAHAAELVSPAGHDPAAELLDVVPALLEFLGELGRAARDG